MMDALPLFFDFTEEQKNCFSKELYDIMITLTVPDENDEVYICGNQPELAQWDPAAIRMDKVSANQRQVKMKIHSPAQIKFTRGDWDTQGAIAGNDGYENLIIYPDKDNDIHLEILEWLDQED
ncbi:MAG: hypothetical protein LUF87_04790 [Alistipes sp.]|nr:hypothetical protein [Alistipes sp.]